MRFATLAGLFFSALSVSAQTAQTDAATNELLGELAQLPKCATTCVASSLSVSECSFGDLDCLCADQAYIAASGKCILSSCTVKEALLAQRWQQKACKAPYRNTGPITSRVGSALVTIAGVGVALRFLARWRIKDSTVGWDDWTILVSFILLIPSTVMLANMANNGMGQDIWTVPFENINKMFKTFWIEQFIYQILVVLTKISIVLLYLRIFPRGVSHTFTYTCWAVIGVLIAYGLSMCIFFLMQCRPINYFWVQWDGQHEGTCINFRLGTYIGSGINIGLDLVVFFLPVPRLVKLQVADTRRKVGVVLTFLVGLFVTICSIIRLKYLAQIGAYSNATYHYNDIGLWSAIEGDVGVICACMPSIAGPLMYFFRTTVASKLNSSSKGGSQSRLSTRITGDKGIARLNSRASDRDDVELEPRSQAQQNKSGIEKTTVTSMYQTSEQSSNDDVDLIYQNERREGRGQWGV